MNHFWTIEGIASALAIIAFTWAIVAWLWESVQTQRTTRRLVLHLFTNHMPHVDHALRLICAKLGIEYTEPPPPPLE